MFLTLRSTNPLDYLSYYHFGFIAFEGLIHWLIMCMNPNLYKSTVLFLSFALYVFCTSWKTVALISDTQYINYSRFFALCGILTTIGVTTYYGIDTIWTTMRSVDLRKPPKVWMANMSEMQLVHSFYIAAFVVLSLAIQRNRLSHGVTDFRMLGSYYFVSVQSYFVIFCGLLTLVPSRLAHLKAEISRDILHTKGSFVKSVSHEIRSPMNVVLAGVELLYRELRAISKGREKEKEKDDAITELAVDVFDSSNSAVLLLNDLMQYESMEGDSFSLDFSWKSLTGFTDLKLRSLIMFAQKNDVQVLVDDKCGLFNHRNLTPEQWKLYLAEKCQLDVNKLCFKIDVSRFDQVIRNLITNAIKFTPKHGKVTVRTTIKILDQYAQDVTPAGRKNDSASIINNHASSVGKQDPLLIGKDDKEEATKLKMDPKAYALALLERSKLAEAIQTQQATQIGTVIVDIIDTGVGISPENQKKVFGEFIQFNRNKLQAGNGSGLGLWISRKIVLQHGGELNFFSEGEGFGTTFYVELPIYAPQEGYSLEKNEFLSELAILKRNSSENKLQSGVHGSKFSSPRGGSQSSHMTGRSNMPKKVIVPMNSTSERESSEGSGSSVSKRQNGNIKSIRGGSDKSMSKKAGASGRAMALGSGRGADDKSAETAVSAITEIFDCGFEHKKARILLVDESSANRKILKRILLSEKTHFPGAIIDEAEDGIQALDKVYQSMQDDVLAPYDYVLLDDNMSRISGSLVAMIMRLKLHYENVIVGVTSNALPSEVATFKDSGVNQVLVKPITRNMLMEAVELSIFEQHSISFDQDGGESEAGDEEDDEDMPGSDKGDYDLNEDFDHFDESTLATN